MEKICIHHLERWLTASDIVMERPCLLHSVLITGDAVGGSDITIYDGHNTGGEVKFVLKAVDDASLPFTPPVPIKCMSGIFVSIGTNVTGVFVQYSIIR